MTNSKLHVDRPGVMVIFGILLIALTANLIRGTHASNVPIDLEHAYAMALRKNGTEEKIRYVTARFLPNVSLLANYLSQDVPSGNFAHSKLSLYSAVAQVYFNLLAAQKDLQNLGVLLELTSDRVKLETRIRSAELVLAHARKAFELVTGLETKIPVADSRDEMPPALPALHLLLTLIENSPAGKAPPQSQQAAVKEIRALHERLTSLIGQHRALRRSLLIAEENYGEQQRDYKYGLVALLDRTRYRALANYASLLAATGMIPYN